MGIKLAAGIFYTDGKSVLLLKRVSNDELNGVWQLPGGKGRGNENYLQIAKRETKEEIGYSFLHGKELGEVLIKNPECSYKGFVRKVDKRPLVKLNKEHSDYEWVPLSQIKHKKLHPKLKEYLSKYLNILKKECRKFAEWYELSEALK